jgi:hypothetical protein
MSKLAKLTKTNKEYDNVVTKGYQDILLESLEDLDIPFDAYNTVVEPLEFESRDGFWAHDRNRGGADFIAFTTTGFLHGSGEHTSTSIENRIEEEYESIWKDTLADNPELDPNNESHLNDLYEALDNTLNNDYCGQAFRIRLMYEGNGVLLVHSGWDNDAPYFRWSNKTDLEQEIKFKTKSELKQKLVKAIAKALKKL